MILLQLFWNFLVIGAVSFGGGYGMISLVRETVLGHGWLTESEFLSFIAVSESTPGPLAVNMATFIGASQAGLAGSFVATVGVVSFGATSWTSNKTFRLEYKPFSSIIFCSKR
jgi:chromate transporter